jgi:hypothetical protein
MKVLVPAALAAILTTSSSLTAQHITVPGVGWEGAGAGVAIANLDGNSRPEMIMMAYDDPQQGNTFRYRVGRNINGAGIASSWSGFVQVPGVGWKGQGAGVAIGDIGGSGRPDMILMAYDNPSGGNTFRYRVGRDLDADGVASSWSSFITVPGVGWEGAGADVALVDLDSNPRPDMILMAYDDPQRANSFRYRIGYNLNSNGVAASWRSGFVTAPGVGWEGQGAGIAIGDFGGNSRPDMVLMAYDNPVGANTFRYRIGLDLNVQGVASSWSTPHVTEPGVGWEGQGAGVAVADLAGDGAPDLVMMAYDNPSRANTFRYRVKPDFAVDRVRIPYSVARHDTAALTNARADQIMADMGTVLQVNDGPGDRNCEVAFDRQGNVTQFTLTDGDIDTFLELGAVFALPGNVKVVDNVDWCAGTLNPSFIGCGQTPGLSFIVERFTANLEGILWAHEYGHNAGLGHNGNSNFLMFASIGNNRLRVTEAECDAYRATGGAGASSASGAVVSTVAAEGDGSSNRLRALFGTDALPPVREFVSQIYFHGLPLDLAAQYGPSDVEALVDMLDDPEMVTFHENIALTLGMIGDTRAVDAMIGYIDAGGVSGDESRRAYKGVVGAMVGLGYLAAQSDDERAVSYLIEAARTAAPAQAMTRLAPQAGGDTATLRSDLSRYAILSLGVTGVPRAQSFLREIQRSPELLQIERRPRDLDVLLRESIDTNTRVNRIGIERFVHPDD